MIAITTEAKTFEGLMMMVFSIVSPTFLNPNQIVSEVKLLGLSTFSRV
jgi:hypothetical protein